MDDKKKKSLKSEFAQIGAIGGRAVYKKHGREYMSELGKRGAAKRWGKEPSEKEQAGFGKDEIV